MMLPQMWLWMMLWSGGRPLVGGFAPSSRLHRPRPLTRTARFAYIPPEADEANQMAVQEKKLYPQIGDVVRYFDIDGGKSDGQVLVGKIAFLQRNMADEKSGWTVEINELEDLKDGFYAEYPARKRRKAIRDLGAVSPLSASFVRTEQAFKVPINKETSIPVPKREFYDTEGYEGPFSGANEIDTSIVEEDGIVYGELKGRLLKYVGLTGFAGAVFVDLIKGAEDAVIFAAGVVASLVYLFFLTIKTDTIARPEGTPGTKLRKTRFLPPFMVLMGVAIYNFMTGAIDTSDINWLSTVKAEQFAAAMLGFLLYRLPLFVVQAQEAFKPDEGGDLNLPGSAGYMYKLLKDDKEQTSLTENEPVTVLLVSGPAATGRSVLVEKFMKNNSDKFATPRMLDRIQEGVTFERFQGRDEILSIDPTGRYGITKDSILDVGKDGSVVVVDADVELAKKLTKIPGTRLIGVWVGLSSVADYENSISSLIDSGDIPILEDETRETTVRARIRDTIKEIEYGISSGIFEFTILNDDEEDSLRQLQDASSYCF